MTTKNTKVTADEVLRLARDLHEDIRGWRREIHRYPELTFTEQRTAGLVNSVLVDRAIETETEIAKTGVVGHIRGGRGPVVALRADMDALPIQEINGTEFDSTRPGIMHACGHDAHTAMLLGAATILKQLADAGQLPGSIRLLFQPSEEAQDREGKSGGMRMVEEGALKGVDAVFGLHVDAQHDVGRVATRPGPMMAAADMFKLVIRGSGGHAARPQSTIDPIAQRQRIGRLPGALEQRDVVVQVHAFVRMPAHQAGHGFQRSRQLAPTRLRQCRFVHGEIVGRIRRRGHKRRSGKYDRGNKRSQREHSQSRS